MSLLDRIRRQKTHEKNREKELAIIAEKTKQAEEARAKGMLQISVSIDSTPDLREQFEKQVMEEIDSTPDLREQFEKQVMEEIGISKAVTQDNVRIACVQMCKIVKAKGPLVCRQQVIMNLPSEIRLVLQGRTLEQAFTFYWEIPEFQTAWTMLKFTETDLRDFISREV
jgi:hypothetical protein